MYNTHFVLRFFFPVFSNLPHQDENDRWKLILVIKIFQLAISIYPRARIYIFLTLSFSLASHLQFKLQAVLCTGM